MDGLILAGRILFVVFFLSAGVAHLRDRRMMAGYVRSAGWVPQALRPVAEPVVVGTGLMLLAGSIMVAAGIYADLGAILLAAFLVPTTLTMHAFWRAPDPAQRRELRSTFLRNVTYLGAALFLFGLVVSAGNDLGLTVTDPVWTIG